VLFNQPPDKCVKLLIMLQVMLWQRKIELEREMNDVLDPSVGGDVVGAMKKEIHRMQLRAGELARIQESLLLDLERSIAKRDTIALKVSHFQQVCISMHEFACLRFCRVQNVSPLCMRWKL